LQADFELAATLRDPAGEVPDHPLKVDNGVRITCSALIPLTGTRRNSHRSVAKAASQALNQGGDNERLFPRRSGP
jgi:hypothetical protein